MPLYKVGLGLACHVTHATHPFRYVIQIRYVQQSCWNSLADIYSYQTEVPSFNGFGNRPNVARCQNVLYGVMRRRRCCRAEVS